MDVESQVTEQEKIHTHGHTHGLQSSDAVCVKDDENEQADERDSVYSENIDMPGAFRFMLEMAGLRKRDFEDVVPRLSLCHNPSWDDLGTSLGHSVVVNGPLAARPEEWISPSLHSMAEGEMEPDYRYPHTQSDHNPDNQSDGNPMTHSERSLVDQYDKQWETEVMDSEYPDHGRETDVPGELETSESDVSSSGIANKTFSYSQMYNLAGAREEMAYDVTSNSGHSMFQDCRPCDSEH